MEKVKLNDVLSEVIDFSSKATYSGRNKASLSRNIPTLSALSVFQNYIDYSKCYYVSLEEYLKMTTKRTPKIGDILITKEAPVGRVAMLDRNNIAIGRRLWLLTGKENVIDNYYLLYFLQWDKTQRLLRSISGGSTVKSINLNTFRNLELEIHPYNEQVKIGNLLNLINKKILLN
ncbi:restriction endonuclease subunit S, partial [Metamycoplasma auris]|uniref:restriction endonuclease subunit S n=1 Tax=Metamycoplasma auris TaxID=51363 RepID=UPI00058D630A